MKKLILICAPVSSRSGYGAHARDLVSSFVENDAYDVKVQDVRWGDCPRDALKEDNPNHKKMMDCFLQGPTLERQPDIYIDIRIPHEFETHGKINIGITAGVETDAVSHKWLESCNKMDLVIVPSEHSKKGFVDTVYDKMENLPDGNKRKVGEMRVEKPIEVLFEGADEDIYKPLSKDEIDSDFFDMLNDKVPERFAFLFVGQWTKGGYGEDRKDIFRLIKLFYETFANQKKQPALILKTNGATFSTLDKEDVLSKINGIKDMFPEGIKLPNVYLLHGDLSDTEINYLYNHPKVKCMISLTHGEGFGRPLLEATMTGLPVIASGWSGHLDFLDRDSSMLLNGQMVQIPNSMVWENVLIAESRWFQVNEKTSSSAMRFAYDNENSIKSKAKTLMHKNRKTFTLNNMSKKLNDIVDKLFVSANIPSQVKLNLPKLSKANSNPPKQPEVKLPKLKKVMEEV
tara:strand:+ start:405 stop:1778 length:1374 start_codon:yes stop_codon:yes gene_type:complete